MGARKETAGWQARRFRQDGVERFCAPRCGGGCTLAEYKKANREANKLARRLGAGWTTDVWENLGWHYQAVSPCGRVKVGGSGSSYTAFLGESGSSGGRWAEHGKTPEAAIKNVAKVAVVSLHKIGAVILDMPVQARLPRAAPQLQGRRP